MAEFWKATVGNLLDALRGILAGLWELGKWAIQNLRDGAASMVQNLLDYIGGLPGRIVEKLGDLTGWLWQKGKDLMDGFASGMKSAILPNPTSLIPGGGFGLPNLPSFGFSEGGVVPGPRGAGDIIPAMLSPGEVVLTEAQQRRVASGGGGGRDIHVHLHGAGFIQDVSALTDQIRRELSRSMA